jgi:hypothetical protein
MRWTSPVAVSIALLALTLAGCGKREEAKIKKSAGEVEAAARALEARATAIDAYIYAYPLVSMDMTRRVMSNVAQPEGSKSPMNQFARLRTYPPADNHSVTTPNADTLYTLAWLDVSKEPQVVSLPDMKGRYVLFPMLDAWTEVFGSPGTRTTGTKAQTYAVTGPGWSGTLPPGVTEYKSATAYVWVLGRIYCTGTAADYKAVHDLQDHVSVVPLSAYGKPYTPTAGVVDPSLDMKTAPREQINALDGAAFFTRFAQLLKLNPPAPADTAMVAKLAKIGIVPGQDFDASKLDPAVAKGIAEAVKPAQGKITAWLKKGIVAGDTKLENGWLFFKTIGNYGTNYRQRAMITYFGIGANTIQDAVYPLSEGPDALKKYSGEHQYCVHFLKGQTPPVHGFWSLTMYDDEMFFVPNPHNRYTVSQRDKLKINADGSVDVYLQHDSPGKDKEANWLPAPAGLFHVILRMYWPTEKPPSVLDGSWELPEVKEVQ